MLAEIRLSEAPSSSIQHPEGESDVISSYSFGKGDEEEEQYSLSSSSRRRRTQQQMASKEEDSVYNESQPEESLRASSYRLDSNDKVSPDGFWQSFRVSLMFCACVAGNVWQAIH